ncbi:MAG: hypothetical protein ACRES4_10525, partial [Nevskiales bacterium]
AHIPVWLGRPRPCGRTVNAGPYRHDRKPIGEDRARLFQTVWPQGSGHASARDGGFACLKKACPVRVD